MSESQTNARPMQAVKEYLIPANMEQLTMNLKAIQSRIDELEVRLTPVLSPDRTTIEANAVEPSDRITNSPMADDVDAMARHAYRLGERLVSLLERVEL